jgi:UDP-glucose 4-epimerase
VRTAGGQPVKWLLTGGCGFIGTRIVKRLVEEGGHYVRVLDNLSVGSRSDLAAVGQFSDLDPGGALSGHGAGALFPAQETRIELVVGDILDESLVAGMAEGIDTIVHLAANTGVGPSVEDPRKDCLTNVLGILNCLEAARHRGVKRFIFASSGAPVGECEPPIHEEVVPHPVSPYGASKLAGEAYCSAYYRTFEVETVALRFGNVYGPGSGHKNSVVAQFIKNARNGKRLEIYGDGKQTRDFIYIEDLVDAVMLAAQVPGIGGEVFQIATNRETTICELVEKLVPILSERGIRNVEVAHAGARQGDVRRNFSDTSKAKRVLGWMVRTGLEDGLRSTVEWHLGN